MAQDQFLVLLKRKIIKKEEPMLSTFAHGAMASSLAQVCLPACVVVASHGPLERWLYRQRQAQLVSSRD